jgi:hypothetical protein
MKSSTAFVLLITLFSGCKKSSDPKPDPNPAPGPQNPTSLVTSYTIFIALNNSMTKDSFRYDAKNNITSISYTYINDVGPYETIDTGTYYFTIDATKMLASSYTFIDRKYYYTEAKTENHVLSYDSQNRLILDSTISYSSPDELPKGVHYQYIDNAVILQHTIKPYDIYIEMQDSILLNNGNFNYFSEFYWSGTDWTKQFSYTREVLTNYPNPFYYSRLSNSLGAFYIFMNISDFLSKNLTTTAGFFYTWTTDAKGRPLNGTTPDGGFVKYIYQ